MNSRFSLFVLLFLLCLPSCNRGRRTTANALPGQVAANVTGGGRVVLDPLGARVLLGSILLQNTLAAATLDGDIRFELALGSLFEADAREVVLRPGEERSLAIYTTDPTVRLLQLAVVASYLQNSLARTFSIAWTNDSADARAALLVQLISGGPLVQLWFQNLLVAAIGGFVPYSGIGVPDGEPDAEQDVRIYGALSTMLSSGQLADAWGGGFDGAVFPLGAGPEGFTVAAQPAAPLAAGQYCMFWLSTVAPIPLAGPTQLLQYAFVVDTDTNPANNWVPAPAFPNDFFKDTDRWYELNYTPAGGWQLRCRVVGAGNTLATVPSGARAILSGDTLLLAVPRSEFGVANPPFRATTFAHLGDFGQNPPFNWSGDPTPPVAAGLQSWQ